MVINEWVKRLETIMGKKAKSSSMKGNQYRCVFRGSAPRTVRTSELHEDDPFYCLSHFYWKEMHASYTQIFVNQTDFIQIIWNRKGSDIWKMEFIHNLFSRSAETFSQVSPKHEQVLEWVNEHYVSKAKNRLEIITKY